MSIFSLRSAYRNKVLAKQQYIDEMHDEHKHLFEYAEMLRETDIARIEITDGTVMVETRENGVWMVCDKADKRIVPLEILNFGSYEKNEMSMVLGLLNDGQVVFDIGANVGWYSINIAKKMPKISIFAFEPIPSTFAYLQRNVQLNRATGVCANNYGFSDFNGDLIFHFHPEGSGSASSADLMGTGAAQKIRCVVRKLDDYVAQSNIKRIDFMKCDVEGAELFVLRGGVESISRFKPIIFAEMLRKWTAKFNYHPNHIIELMATLGYRCYVSSGNGLTEFVAMDEHTVETNFFFLHLTAHAEKIRQLSAISRI